MAFFIPIFFGIDFKRGGLLGGRVVFRIMHILKKIGYPNMRFRFTGPAINCEASCFCLLPDTGNYIVDLAFQLEVLLARQVDCG